MILQQCPNYRNSPLHGEAGSCKTCHFRPIPQTQYLHMCNIINRLYTTLPPPPPPPTVPAPPPPPPSPGQQEVVHASSKHLSNQNFSIIAAFLHLLKQQDVTLIMDRLLLESRPVFATQGNFPSTLRPFQTSRRDSKASWYCTKSSSIIHEVESLIIHRVEPLYLLVLYGLMMCRVNYVPALPGVGGCS